MKHSPAPWNVERLPIQSSGGSCTCWKIGPMSACIYDDGRARSAGVSEAENAANALLLAAAPELLEALEGILAITDRDHAAWHKARAACAKAKGEA